MVDSGGKEVEEQGKHEEVWCDRQSNNGWSGRSKLVIHFPTPPRRYADALTSLYSYGL